MLTLFVCTAFAGTIKLHSPTPLSFRIDGENVGRVTTDLTLTDIPEGAHEIEAVDTFGKVVASTQIILREGEPLWFEYANRRFLRVDTENVNKPTGPRPPITDAQYTWVEHRIVRKRKDHKKLKRLGEVVDRYWFEMRHVDKLLLAFPSLAARVEATRMLAPRTIDPEKTKAIESHFPPGTFRDQAMSAFAIYK